MKKTASAPCKDVALTKPASVNKQTQTAVSPAEPMELLLQRAEYLPGNLLPYESQRLQQTVGNHALGRLDNSTDNGTSANNTTQSTFHAILNRVGQQPKIGETAVQQQTDNPLALNGGNISTDTENAVQQSRSSGRPLSDSFRGPMEQAFGADFSSVKIHTDGQSDTLNRSLNARAFTTGSDIFFRQGEFDPTGSSGQELLAHELTHVVQQGAAEQLQRESETVIQRRSNEETAVPLPPSSTPAAANAAEPDTISGSASDSTAVSPTPNGSAPTAKNQPANQPTISAPSTAVSANSTTPTAEPAPQPAAAANDTPPTGLCSPASAAEDPGFQAVTERATAAAAGQTTHQEATAAAKGAQAAAPSPTNEVAGQAAAVQVDEMNAQEAQPFDKQAFKATLMARIAELTPATLEDADEFPNNNNLDAMQSELSSEIDDSREQSGENIAETTEEAPDTGAVTPRQPQPLQPEAAGPPPADIGAQEAAPTPRTTAEVEAPIQAGSHELDEQMAAANVTEAQLANANEPAFTSALDTRQTAQTAAAATPAAYRREEQGMVAQAQSQATEAAATGLTGMNAERTAVLAQVIGEQATTATADEAERAVVADHIEEIYAGTQKAVEDRLAQLDEEVDDAFTAGAAAAQEAFENYHRTRMDAYKDERYDGLEGAALWVSDKLFGMPDEVNAFYQDGRALYIQQMDQVLSNIAETVAAGLTEAKTLIAQGRQEVQTYVVGLPESLRQVGAEAAENIQNRFNELDQRVNDKQGELIDNLAQRYNENLQAIDARIEALQAENQGLVNAALDALSGVINTILELKEMLANVLARIAGAIEMIIADPIGFLGNLIAGVKLGFENFVANIGEHLEGGLIGWLTGALTEAGIELPETWDLAGIFQLVMQVLGLSFESLMGRVSNLLGLDVMGVWGSIQELIGIYQEGGLAGMAEYGLTQLIGEDNMAMLIDVVDMLQVVIEGNIDQLWEIVSEHLSNLKELIFGQITEFITERVIRAGITWLISLFNPASAFIRACMMIYDVIMFFIERGQQIMSLVTAVIQSVTSIAQGNISAAANFIEQALARAVPVAISFLASLLGLGGISGKVRDIIKSVQTMVDNALNAVFNSGPVQAVAGFLRRIIARVQALIQHGTDRVGSALGLNQEDEELDNELANENGDINHDVMAQQVVNSLEEMDSDSEDYTALRAAKEVEARQLEERYTQMLEPGVALRINFNDAQSDQEDSDLDFEVVIAPNDTKKSGAVASSDGNALKLKEAIETIGIIDFMRAMAQNQTVSTIDRATFDSLYNDSNQKIGSKTARRWVQDKFRAADSGRHEWIPTNLLDVVISRAASPELFLDGSRWINLQHSLRVDTSWVVFKPNYWERFLYNRLVSEAGDRAEKEYLLPHGHPGALRLGSGGGSTAGSLHENHGEFNSELENVFGQSTTIESYFDHLIAVIEKWVWDGGAVNGEIFHLVYYEGHPIKNTSQFADTHQKHYTDMRINLMRIKREVLED